jgi:hypothetical protein
MWAAPRARLRETGPLALRGAPLTPLAQHYGFGLENAFAPAGTSRVIVLEEDIDVAPDFFKFFERLSPYLDDPNEDLLCISAWNDNGMRGYVSDEKKVGPSGRGGRAFPRPNPPFFRADRPVGLLPGARLDAVPADVRGPPPLAARLLG